MLGVIPYTQQRVTEWLGLWILVPPILGVVLAIFGLLRIYHELKMLDHIRYLYWGLQDDLFYEFYGVSVRNTFGLSVMLYTAFLTLLAAGNTLLIDVCWLPNDLELIYRIHESRLYCP